MNWVHFREDQCKKPISDFRVGAYPTTFLLDHENRIVATNFELRGQNLMMTVGKQLGLTTSEIGKMVKNR